MAVTQKFTNSGLVSFTCLSSHNSGLRTHNIDTLTIHTMAGNMTAENCARMFAGNSTQASSNYCIGSDGKIAMSVEEKNRSWCSSNGPNDQRAITIEVASLTVTEPFPCSQQAWNALIDLCTDICIRNNIKELKWKADKSLIGQVDKQNMTVHRWFTNNRSCLPIRTILEVKGKDGNIRNKQICDITEEDSVESYTCDGAFTTWKHVLDIVEPYQAIVYEFNCGIVATGNHRLLVKRSPSADEPFLTLTVDEILDEVDKIGTSFYVTDGNEWTPLGNIRDSYETMVACISVPDGYIKATFGNGRSYIVGNCPGEYLYSNMGKIAEQVNIRLKANQLLIAGSTAASLMNKSNEEYIQSYLKGKQMNNYAICAIMGCMYAESGFIPNNLENTAEKKLNLTDEKYTLVVDKGAYTNFAKDGYGYGLCQWTYSLGKQRLLEFAKQRNKSVGDLYTQCEFFWWDLNNNFKNLKAKLDAAKTLPDALHAFLNTYEYGGIAPDSIYQKRLGYATTFYEKYVTKPAATNTSNDVGKRPDAARSRKIPYLVRVAVDELRIRSQPTVDSKLNGSIKDRSVYTIVQESTGNGAKLWGKLKSGAGWIALDYTSFVKNV